MVFKKIIFQNSLMALETPSRPPPPFMANAILNFHFDYLNTSLSKFYVILRPLNTVYARQYGMFQNEKLRAEHSFYRIYCMLLYFTVFTVLHYSRLSVALIVTDLNLVCITLLHYYLSTILQ